MKPDKCSFCKGKLVIGKTEFTVKVGKEVLTIKDVSAYICEECGEAYYTPDVSEKIDEIMKKFHEATLLVHPLAAGELSLGEVAAQGYSWTFETSGAGFRKISPVIGTIPMVAIVVILAAIIAAYSFGMFSGQKTAPQASIRIMSADTAANTLTLEHQGGGDLILSYVKVIVEQGNNRLSFENAGNSSSRFAAGDKLKIINLSTTPVIRLNDNATTSNGLTGSFALVPGVDIKVTLIDVPSAQKISDLKIKT